LKLSDSIVTELLDHLERCVVVGVVRACH